jgi:glycosyltransferase involved in cell wall biosynthesis
VSGAFRHEDAAQGTPPDLFSGARSRVIVHNAEDKRYLVAFLGIEPDHITVTVAFVRRREPHLVIYAPPRELIRCRRGIEDALLAQQADRHQDDLARLRHERVAVRELVRLDAAAGHPSSLTQQDIEALEQSSPRIKFIGHQPSLVSCYQACDIVCVPTKYREGLPTALLEAAASGRPIVTCDNIGGREFITDGQTGLIVPRAAPLALADAIERLISDPELADRLRRAAFRHFLKGFTKDVMVAQTLAVFRDLGLGVSPGVSSGARGMEQTA